MAHFYRVFVSVSCRGETKWFLRNPKARRGKTAREVTARFGSEAKAMAVQSGAFDRHPRDFAGVNRVQG
jgi:hypothetical protein